MKVRTLISLVLVGVMIFSIPVSGVTYRKELESFPSDIGNVSRYENVSDSPLYKKSAIFFGDSLCRATPDVEAGSKIEGYAGRVGDKYSMDWNKAGKSGWSYAKTSINDAIYKQVLSNKGKKYDYVIFQGAVNDAGRDAPLGTLSDGFELSGFSETDPPTTAKGLERAFYEAKKAYPNAVFGFIMMYQMPGTKYSDVGKYYDLVKEACEKWDIQFLNMFEDQDFCDNVMRINEVGKYIQSDRVHMTRDGYDVISPYIAAWMETLVADAKFVQNFKDSVADISNADTVEAKYEKIQSALKSYSGLNVHEKKEVANEYQTLQSAVSAYNTNAKNANTSLAEASKVAFVPLTVGAGLGLLSSFLALVKKLLGI